MEKQASGRSAVTPSNLFVPHSKGILSSGIIETLSARELRKVLPQLVAMLHESEPKRPDWWPRVLPWTQHRLINAVKTATASSMRNVARKCYNFLTQHSTRPQPAPAPVFTQPRVLDWVNSHPPGRSCSQPVKSGVKPNPKKPVGVPYLDIYLCYQCNEEFSTKETLQKHQIQCQGGTLPLSIPSTPPISEAPSPAPPTSTPDDSGSVGVASASTSPSSRSALPQSHFVTALDLVPIHRARKIRQASRRNTECETIDLEEPQTPVSPNTPRTHKILITQLSRDASSNSFSGNGISSGLGSRRSSCLRLSLDKRPDNVESEKEGEQASDGESSESNAEDADEPKLRKKSLFNIDVSSALGQRVIKHMTSEVHVPVISDLEEYCRTPIKDKYQDRLRIRQTVYPVTWKLTRKRQQQYYHVYKFTRADRLEFKEAMRTGLSWQSRKLRNSLKKCSVVVKCLSRKTLVRWNAVKQAFLKRGTLAQAKTTSPEKSVFPEGPSFLFMDVDRVLGLKRKDGRPELARKLLASHCVSETANAELQSQKLTVYRCLLTDLYSSVTSDAIQCPEDGMSVSSNQKGTRKSKQNYPALLSILSGTGSQFKLPFQNRPAAGVSADLKEPLKIDIPSPVSGMLTGEKNSYLDDSFSVKTGSSDEDSDKSAACCSLCAVRNKCDCPVNEEPSTVVAPGTCSPAVNSQVSTLSKASLIPPALDPLSLPPEVSMSSHPSLSPPNLSPVSQASDACLQSPSHLRLCSKRSTLLLKTTASLPKVSSTNLVSAAARSGNFQCSSLPSHEFKRSDKMMTRQTHRSPVLSGSTNLLKPLLVPHMQRPLTRSGSKQKVASESSGSILQQKSSLTLLGCTCCGTDSVAGNGSPIKSVSSSNTSSMESPLTPSSMHIDGKKSIIDPGTQDSGTPQSNLKGKTGQTVDRCLCTNSVNVAHPELEEKETCLKISIETTERVKGKTTRENLKEGRLEKMQMRASLQEDAVKSSKLSGHGEMMTDTEKVSNMKRRSAGEVRMESNQNVEDGKNTRIEEGGKARKKDAEQLLHTAIAKDVGEMEIRKRHTGGSRALRNRERNSIEEGINESADRENTFTCSSSIQELRKKRSKVAQIVADVGKKDDRELRSTVGKKIEETRKEESIGSRKLRSRETKDHPTENIEVKITREVKRKDQVKIREMKTKQMKETRELGKLKTEASEQMKNQNKDAEEKRSYGESRNKDLQDIKELLKKRTEDWKDLRKKDSQDKSKMDNMDAKDTKSLGNKTESANTAEVKNVDTETEGQNADFRYRCYDKNQSVVGKGIFSESTEPSIYRSDASEKEQGSTANQRSLLRKNSSWKHIANVQTGISVQADSTKKNGRRLARGASVPSMNGPENSFSCTKKGIQETDASIGAEEPKGMKRKGILTFEERGTKESPDSGFGSVSHVNPFLISRAQTRLFSSHIKEHNHRAWKLAQQLPATKGGNSRGLRSGNTFRMSNVLLGSQTDSCCVKSKRTERFAPPSSSLLHSDKPATSVGAKSPIYGASVNGDGPLSPSRKGLSPKQMLSVLESTKCSSSPSKVKSRKEPQSKIARMQDSSAVHPVRSESFNRSTSSQGSQVNSFACQGSPSEGTSSPTSGKSTTNQKSSPECFGNQGSTTISMSNQKSSLRSTVKLRPSARSSVSHQSAYKNINKQKGPEYDVTKGKGKRPSSDIGTREMDSPHKKLRF